MSLPLCLSLSLSLSARVVSGSRDTTLRVWDVSTGRCEHVLTGHVAAVRCVQYDGRRVVSGGYDYMVKVWDPETEACLFTLQGHTNRVYSLQVSAHMRSYRDRHTHTGLQQRICEIDENGLLKVALCDYY